jgi:hypothetical protein
MVVDVVALKKQVDKLQADVVEAQRQRARSDHDLSIATVALDTAKSRLHDEFGVDSIDEAQTILSELVMKLEDEIQLVNNALVKANEEQ